MVKNKGKENEEGAVYVVHSVASGNGVLSWSHKKSILEDLCMDDEM